MMTLMEDLTVTIQEMCLAVGLSGTAVRVLPAVLLGFVMNIVAMNVVDSLIARHHSSIQHPLLARISRAELKLARTAVTSSIKGICETRRRLSSTEQWLLSLKNCPTSNEVQLKLKYLTTVSREAAACALAVTNSGLWESSCELTAHVA